MTAKGQLAAVLLTAGLAAAQQATLPRKGRQPERVPARVYEPIRRLPREAHSAVAVPSALERYIEDQRRTRPERPLLFGPVEPAITSTAEPIRTLPRTPAPDPVVAIAVAT